MGWGWGAPVSVSLLFYSDCSLPFANLPIVFRILFVYFVCFLVWLLALLVYIVDCALKANVVLCISVLVCLSNVFLILCIHFFVCVIFVLTINKLQKAVVTRISYLLYLLFIRVFIKLRLRFCYCDTCQYTHVVVITLRVHHGDSGVRQIILNSPSPRLRTLTILAISLTPWNSSQLIFSTEFPA